VVLVLRWLGATSGVAARRAGRPAGDGGWAWRAAGCGGGSGGGTEPGGAICGL